MFVVAAGLRKCPKRRRDESDDGTHDHKDVEASAAGGEVEDVDGEGVEATLPKQRGKRATSHIIPGKRANNIATAAASPSKRILQCHLYLVHLMQHVHCRLLSNKLPQRCSRTYTCCQPKQLRL